MELGTVMERSCDLNRQKPSIKRFRTVNRIEKEAEVV